MKVIRTSTASQRSKSRDQVQVIILFTSVSKGALQGNMSRFIQQPCLAHFLGTDLPKQGTVGILHLTPPSSCSILIRLGSGPGVSPCSHSTPPTTTCLQTEIEAVLWQLSHETGSYADHVCARAHLRGSQKSSSTIFTHPSSITEPRLLSGNASVGQDLEAASYIDNQTVP